MWEKRIRRFGVTLRRTRLWRGIYSLLRRCFNLHQSKARSHGAHGEFLNIGNFDGYPFSRLATKFKINLFHCVIGNTILIMSDIMSTCTLHEIQIARLAPLLSFPEDFVAFKDSLSNTNNQNTVPDLGRVHAFTAAPAAKTLDSQAMVAYIETAFP
jgi:hypothetical protein